MTLGVRLCVCVVFVYFFQTSAWTNPVHVMNMERNGKKEKNCVNVFPGQCVCGRRIPI